MKYKKKPVVIEASQWFKNGDHPEDGAETFMDRDCEPQRCEGEVVRYFRRPDVESGKLCEHCQTEMGGHGWIDTLEGGHKVCPGDFVITGVKGERYPCKPDIFAMTYEPVNPPVELVEEKAQ